MLSVLVLAISLSLDAVGVGFAYGLKKIRISTFSWILMSLISLLCTFLSAAFGKFFYLLLPDRIGSWLSIALLLAMGLYMIKNAMYGHSSSDGKPVSAPQPLCEPEPRQYILHILGLTITVMQDPPKCDFDQSQTIDPGESVYIGLALSLDSIGAGIGYAMSSASIFLFPVCISLFQVLFLLFGIRLGRRFTSLRISESVFSYLPGIIMLLLAFLRLFT